MPFTLLLCFVSFAPAAAQPQPDLDYMAKYREWEQYAYADSPSAEQVAECFSALRAAWTASPERLKRAKADIYTNAALRTAELLLDDGHATEPGELLREAGDIAATYSLELGRGRSSTAFRRVASTHARVIARTNRDPLEGAPLGYELGKLTEGYYAFQPSLGADRTTSSASPFPIENLAPNESAGTFLRIDGEGMVVEALPAVIVDGSGSLRSRLKAILKYEPAGVHGPGRFVRKEAEPFFGMRENSIAIPTSERTSPASALVEQSTPVAAGEIASAKQSEPPGFPVLPVAILGAVIIGIVLYLLRRKST